MIYFSPLHHILLFLSLFTASRIRYEITSGNIGGAFAVKNMTGAIYVAGALDYETRKRVSLNLSVIITLGYSHLSFSLLILLGRCSLF